MNFHPLSSSWAVGCEHHEVHMKITLIKAKFDVCCCDIFPPYKIKTNTANSLQRSRMALERLIWCMRRWILMCTIVLMMPRRPIFSLMTKIVHLKFINTSPIRVKIPNTILRCNSVFSQCFCSVFRLNSILKKMAGYRTEKIKYSVYRIFGKNSAGCISKYYSLQKSQNKTSQNCFVAKVRANSTTVDVNWFVENQ